MPHAPLRRRSVLAGLAFTAGALLGGISVRGAEEARFFRIGTAATGGSYFQIGGVIASALSRAQGAAACDRNNACGVPGLVAVAQATQGSVENLRLIRNGQLEAGFSQADVASWAYQGGNVFAADGPMRNLRSIGSLFPEIVHLVVANDGPIRELADLKTRRISLGEQKSGTIASARLVLEEAGIKEADLKPEFMRLAQAAEALRDGTLDGFFLIGGFPVPAIAELASVFPIRLVPIDAEITDRLKNRFGYYTATSVPADAYPGLTADTATIGIQALLAVDANADEDLVYAMTKALWSDGTSKLLAARNPLGKSVRLENALIGLSVPLHRGAARFYGDVGMSLEGVPQAAPEKKPDAGAGQ